MSSHYLNCELHLAGYNQATLTVSSGRAYTGRPRLDDHNLRRQLNESLLDTSRYGDLLLNALLAGENNNLLAGFREVLAIAQHQDKRLRFLLRVDLNAPQELQQLPWELLLDSKKKIALGRSRYTAFSRYLDIPMEQRQVVNEKPRMLIVIAAPNDLEEYGLAEINQDRIRQAMEETLSPLRELVTYEFLERPATPARLSDRLVGGRFHALHLYAHGSLRQQDSTAKLVLESEDGGAAFVDEEIFSEIFEAERSLRLITLIACHGGAQAGTDPFSGVGRALVERGIPAVLAMQRSIGVDTATRFTEHFYRNLARTGRVDVAANEARLQLHLLGNREWATPALFMRLKDGLLWQPRNGVQNGAMISWSEIEWELLLDRLADDKLLPILGPEMCRGLLPSANEIAARWTAKYEYPLGGEPALTSFAQYLAMMSREADYPHELLQETLIEDLLDRIKPTQREALKSLMKKRGGLTEAIELVAKDYFDADENEPHLLLARLPISTYITTNIDGFMTAALKREPVRLPGGNLQLKTPRREHCRWDWEVEELKSLEEYKQLDGSVAEPLVFHLYGNDLELSSYVLTEDNFLDFLTAVAEDSSYDRIPAHIRAALVERELLFLGYNICNLDCRALFRGLVQLNPRRGGRLGTAGSKKRIAVIQLEAEGFSSRDVSALTHFADKFCGSLEITVFRASVRGFLKDLCTRWDARKEKRNNHVHA